MFAVVFENSDLLGKISIEARTLFSGETLDVLQSLNGGLNGILDAVLINIRRLKSHIRDKNDVVIFHLQETLPHEKTLHLTTHQAVLQFSRGERSDHGGVLIQHLHLTQRSGHNHIDHIRLKGDSIGSYYLEMES